MLFWDDSVIITKTKKYKVQQSAVNFYNKTKLHYNAKTIILVIVFYVRYRQF